MAEQDRRYDDPDLQKFADENREMIEKLLAEEKARKEKARAEEAARAEAEDNARRTAQRRYEEAMARDRMAAAERGLREAGERGYDGYRYARDRTAAAFDEGRDFARDFVRDQADYAYDAARESRERLRARMEEERLYAYEAMEERRARMREDRERMRRYVTEDLSDAFGFFADPKFQQHLVGAGLEMWMALNSLIRNSPAPDFVKDFMQGADRNKNVEYCRKNEYCRSKKNPDAPRYREGGEDYDKASEDADAGPEPIKITPVKKTDSGEEDKDGQ